MTFVGRLLIKSRYRLLNTALTTDLKKVYILEEISPIYTHNNSYTNHIAPKWFVVNEKELINFCIDRGEYDDIFLL